MYVPIKLIVGIDPGGTTGLAVYWPTPQGDVVWERQQIEGCNTGNGLKQVVKYIQGCLTTVQPFLAKPCVHIVCESFEDRMAERYRTKIDLVAREVIGVLKYWAVDRDYVKLMLSSASVGKGFWTDDKVRTIGLWVAGKRHAMDATRHVLRYRTFQLGDTSLLRAFQPTHDERQGLGEEHRDKQIDNVIDSL